MHHKSTNDLGTRRDRLMHEHIHDPYKTPHKLPEPTVCPSCGAVFRDGRWQWNSAPKDAHRVCCQACHRIRDNYPAGLITLYGAYALAHQSELFELARNCEAEEKSLHPLHRIMKMEAHGPSLVIQTTDIHLPHHIAEGIAHAHGGELNIQYDKEGHFVRVDWRRD